MSVYLDVVCSDRHLSPAEDRQKKMRAIGEILPFVFAKYGIGAADSAAQPRRNATDRQPRFRNQSRLRNQTRFDD